MMEHLQPVKRGSLSVNSLLSFIPTIAKLHSLTFGEKFLKYQDRFTPWLPIYCSKELTALRQNNVEITKILLDEAMKQPSLEKLLKPAYPLLQKSLVKGPDFFPELLQTGQSLIHGDSHVLNIGYRNTARSTGKKIRLIDWESAKYAPIWFDMATLVELLIDSREDLQSKADQIRRQCMDLYATEMRRYGITFKTDPLDLLKMAYLQRALERKLKKELTNALSGETLIKLKIYVRKITVWGEKLDLF